MTNTYTVLLLDDEPLILMDLEFAADDRGCTVLSTSTCHAALEAVSQNADTLDVAVLDVSLGGGSNCFAVARELTRLGIPFILHSGDLDRHDEAIRTIDAELIAKPTAADKVIGAAIAHCESMKVSNQRQAAE